MTMLFILHLPLIKLMGMALATQHITNACQRKLFFFKIEKYFYHLVCLVFLWPYKWAACLSFDVAQDFQHDISIHMTIVDMEMIMKK